MSKTINIRNLVLQFDSKGGDPIQEAQQIIDLINKTIGMSEFESQPQIMSSGLDSSDVEVFGDAEDMKE